MIKLKNVSYTYPNGVKALRNLNLQIDDGEKVFIGGSTGSGKSTLLRIFNGLIPNFYGGRLEGEVSIYSTKDKKELIKRVYFVSQNVEEQIVSSVVKYEMAFPLMQRGYDFKDAIEIVYDISKKLKIEHLLDKKTHELSDGEKQMILIAEAIACEVDCIVLDEPFAHLHPNISEKILKLILREDKTVILSEHRVEFASYFDREFWFNKPNFYGIELEDGDLGDTVVKADSISFSYGDKVLFDDLSFEFRRGGIYAIIGLNGSGKTTLLKLIAGLLKPKEGSIETKGSVSLAFQYPNYHFSENTVEREVDFNLLKMFELERLAKRHPHSLSSGEAKRLSIAKAFSGDIVLLDEPTAGQDYIFRNKLLEIARKSGKTVIIATHDLRLAKACDGVIDLDKKTTFNC